MKKYRFPYSAVHEAYEKNRLERKPLFLGIELEVAHNEYAHTDESYCECDYCLYEEGDECFRDYSYTNDHHPHSPYFEPGYDCSIEPGGFEFRSNPISIARLEKGRKEIDSWLNALQDEGFFSGTKGHCGMHVHINNEAVGPFQLHKMMRFFDANKQSIYEFSKRTLNAYESWCSNIRYKPTSPDAIEHAKEFKTRRSYPRGSVACRAGLNVANGRTIELRIFNGTLDPSEFWANIQFVTAFYFMTRDMPPADMNFATMYQYTEGKKEYKDLRNQLVDIFKQPHRSDVTFV